jgi:heme o synthase
MKKYYWLVKPGIIYGNALTAMAGFLLADRGRFDVVLFLAMLAGICLVMASGCVFNNVWDRQADSKMERTKNRALVTGEISTTNALAYGTVLGLIGFGLLYFYTNALTTLIAAIGFAFYVLVYTPLKHRTVYGTLLGAVAGAVPPVVGYCAVTNELDIGAWLLFLILVVWQMPHFYAIGINRFDDYKAAGIPICQCKKEYTSPKSRF